MSKSKKRNNPFFRISFRFEFSFFLIAALSLSLDKTPVTFLSLAACCLHECAHAAALLLFSKERFCLRFSAGGMSLRRTGLPFSAPREFAVVSAGPLLNLVLAGAMWAAGARIFSAVNLVCGIFNLLPVSFLDGGRLFALFLPRSVSPVILPRILTAVSVLVLLPMAAAAFYYMLKSGLNISLAIFFAYAIAYVAMRE